MFLQINSFSHIDPAHFTTTSTYPQCSYKTLRARIHLVHLFEVHLTAINMNFFTFIGFISNCARN